ncbi:hypothetical protein CC79DRAFT_1370729 [Sarocladium strictum]|jgi:hypothetical protein
MFSVRNLSVILPLLASATAWEMQYSHHPNCAKEDEAPADPYSGPAGITFPEQPLADAGYPSSESIEPYQYQSLVVTDWDDNCVIEFFDFGSDNDQEPSFVLEIDDFRYVHEFKENSVCIYDMPGNTVTGDGSMQSFRYLCE